MIELHGLHRISEASYKLPPPGCICVALPDTRYNFVMSD